VAFCWGWSEKRHDGVSPAPGENGLKQDELSGYAGPVRKSYRWRAPPARSRIEDDDDDEDDSEINETNRRTKGRSLVSEQVDVSLRDQVLLADIELFHQEGGDSLAIRISLALGKHDLQLHERAQAIDLVQMDARPSGQK
jgi:hypothetical protein